MEGTLIIPRMRVTWGDINLSAYNGTGPFPKGEPLIFDAEVQLQSQSEAPTGSFSWNPTGPAFAVYEKLISDEKYLKSRIYIDILYFGGKKFRLAFVWAGQSISYGNDMTVKVFLKTELDGLINANIRNVTQAYDEKKGGTGIDSINRGIEQFKISNKQIVRYTGKAKKDLEKMKILTNYAQDQTFGAFVANTVQQNGNVAFANTIGDPNISVYTPYTWEKDDAEVLNAATEIKVDQGPEANKRYGYIVGPSIITALVRESKWQPPQQTTQNTPSTQIRARDQKTGQYKKGDPVAVQQEKETSKPSSSPQGTALGRPNPGIQNKENPDGPTKQNLLTQEGTATMTFQTLMCPLLVGVKPHDIIYIPSLKGDYIEDWIVDTVSYDQSDGNVSISVSAKRTRGLGTPMNAKPAEKFLKFAESNNLVGPNATLAAWEKYAWSLPGR